MPLSESDPNQQVDHALFYERLGWSVVPTHRVIRTPDGAPACTCPAGATCTSKGKHPALAWTPYQAKAPTTIQLQAWFNGAYRGFGVGIITGRVSGLFVVDVDEAPGKPGGEILNDLQMIHGDLPITVQARTGGGGRHIIFRHPGTGWIATAKNVLGPGIDIRGDGGFVVTAPSLHESGRIYLWDANCHPQNTTVADAPAWLLEAVSSDAPPAPGATGTQRQPATGTGEIVRDEWGRVVDGRERHLIGIVCGVIATHCRNTHSLPAPDAVFAEAWPTYARTTRARGASLEADNRGETLMRHRIAHMLRRAEQGKWRPLAGSSADGRVGGPEADPADGGDEWTEWANGRAGEADARQQSPPPPPPLIATPFNPAKMLAMEPRKWVYGHFIIRRFLSVLGAPGGTGKTAYAMAIGVSVALNQPLLDEPVHEAGPVWIYNLEDPEDEALRRLHAILLQHNIDPDTLIDRLYLDSGRDKPLIIAAKADNGSLVAMPVFEALIAELKRREIRLLIVDPFVKSHRLEENRNEQVDFAATLWNQVAAEADCSILLLHHFRKGGEAGQADSFRGASALIDASRAAVSLSVMSENEADRLNVENDDRRFHVRADNAKLNLAPPPTVATWLRLNSVDLPNGDKVQAVSRWVPPSPWAGIPMSIIVRILDRIDAGLLTDDDHERERYTVSRNNADKSRWAGTVLVEEAGITDGQANDILRVWCGTALLIKAPYYSIARRRDMNGVAVDKARLSEMRQFSKAQPGETSC